MDSTRLRRRQLFIGVLLILIVTIVGGSFWLRLRSVRQQNQAATNETDTAPELTPLAKLPPAKQGFVGSQACAECHQEIYDKYSQHPMANSLAKVSEASQLEDYSKASFAPDGPRRYRAERTDDGVVHVESMVDGADEPIYEHKVPIAYALGSGQHGRSYVLEKNGRLFQSSIGWYAEGNRWGLSPGYRPDVHQRFERAIKDGCLYCHSGRLVNQTARPELYESPPFAEAAIGCERCHGPGQDHVERQRKGKLTGPDATIVNPARLDPARREAVCNQCHLQGEKVVTRLGRGFFDFRPGEYLDDSLMVLVHGVRVDQQRRTRPVSQVEQMRSSACYTKSQGRMGCTSCHDPHENVPQDRQDAYYRTRCLECHQDKGCSLPEPERLRKSPQDACATCHMPALATKEVAHTSLTDHRVLRVPDNAKAESRLPEPDEIELFDGAESRIPKREADRARAYALLDIAVARNDQVLAARAEEYLVPPAIAGLPLREILLTFGDDLDSIEYLGRAYKLQNRTDEAVLCWKYILSQAPRSESTCLLLADIYQNSQQWKEALDYLDRALAINPTLSILHGRRTYVLGQLGRLDEGIASARIALEIDPTLVQVREWLVSTYDRLGRTEERDAERQTLERMKAALNLP